MALEVGEITHVSLELLHPNPYQPKSRLEVKEEVAKEFGLSILEKGLLQIPVCRSVQKGKGIVETQMVDGWLRRPDKMPDIAWVKEIVQAADAAHIPVWLKENLKPLLWNEKERTLIPDWARMGGEYDGAGGFLFRQERPG